jgi:hypothetical protein
MINHIFSYHTLVDFLLFAPMGAIAGSLLTVAVYYIWQRVNLMIKIREGLKENEWYINKKMPPGEMSPLEDDEGELLAYIYKTKQSRILLKTMSMGQEIFATYCQGHLEEISEFEWMEKGGFELLANENDEDDGVIV